MQQNSNPSVRKVRTPATSSLTRILSKRVAWFSIAICLLLLAAVAGVTQRNAGAYAAQATHAVSHPKHLPSPHHPPRPSVHGRVAPTMTLSASSLSFTQSRANPQASTQSLTIKNNGSRPLYWHIAPVTAPVAAWISSYAPAKGTVGGGVTVTITFTVKSAQQAVGTYTTQFLLSGSDQQGTVVAGSPQTISLSLTVTQ